MSKIYYPTRWGDVNIEEEDGKTVVTTTELTRLEELQVRALMEHFKIDVPKELKELQNQKIAINEPLGKVHKAMKRLLKPGKPTLTAIKLKNGRMEMVEELDEAKEFETAVTVQKPPRGCPMPSVTDRKEEKATKVLREFLTPIQFSDYQKNGMLVAKGCSTGNPYLITSRWNPKVEQYGRLYDLLNKTSICASCKEIPPSEEVLSLVLSVQLDELPFINRNDDLIPV